MSEPYFDVPLNLPHAARLTHRLGYQLERCCERAEIVPLSRRTLFEHAEHLVKLLEPYIEGEENPEAEEAARVVDEAASRARQLVDGIEQSGVGDDRLGQVVRNFFECLELGKEGAKLSLRAGENPQSLLRPN